MTSGVVSAVAIPTGKNVAARISIALYIQPPLLFRDLQRINNLSPAYHRAHVMKVKSGRQECTRVRSFTYFPPNCFTGQEAGETCIYNKIAPFPFRLMMPEQSRSR